MEICKCDTVLGKTSRVIPRIELMLPGMVPSGTGEVLFFHFFVLPWPHKHSLSFVALG